MPEGDALRELALPDAEDRDDALLSLVVDRERVVPWQRCAGEVHHQLAASVERARGRLRATGARVPKAHEERAGARGVVLVPDRERHGEAGSDIHARGTAVCDDAAIRERERCSNWRCDGRHRSARRLRRHRRPTGTLRRRRCLTSWRRRGRLSGDRNWRGGSRRDVGLVRRKGARDWCVLRTRDDRGCATTNDEKHENDREERRRAALLARRGRRSGEVRDLVRAVPLRGELATAWREDRRDPLFAVLAPRGRELDRKSTRLNS